MMTTPSSARSRTTSCSLEPLITAKHWSSAEQILQSFQFSRNQSRRELHSLSQTLSPSLSKPRSVNATMSMIRARHSITVLRLCGTCMLRTVRRRLLLPIASTSSYFVHFTPQLHAHSMPQIRDILHSSDKVHQAVCSGCLDPSFSSCESRDRDEPDRPHQIPWFG